MKGVDFVAVIVSLCKQTFRLRHWFVLAAEFLTLSVTGEIGKMPKILLSKMKPFAYDNLSQQKSNQSSLHCPQIFPSTGFKYTYKLFVDGLECEIYNQTQSRILKTWEIKINDKTYRVVLEKDTLNIYLNGTLREEKPEFVDGGTDTQFLEDEHNFIVSARSGTQEPICYKLSVNGAVQEVV